MPSDVVSVAAASASLETDLLSVTPEKRTRTSPVDRVLVGVAYTGSNAVGDTAVDVYIDQVLIGRFFNSKTGTPDRDDMVPTGGLGWPAGAKLSAIVVDIPSTNPVFFQYAWEDLE